MGNAGSCVGSGALLATVTLVEKDRRAVELR